MVIRGHVLPSQAEVLVNYPPFISKPLQNICASSLELGGLSFDYPSGDKSIDTYCAIFTFVKPPQISDRIYFIVDCFPSLFKSYSYVSNPCKRAV